MFCSTCGAPVTSEEGECTSCAEGLSAGGRSTTQAKLVLVSLPSLVRVTEQDDRRREGPAAALQGRLCPVPSQVFASSSAGPLAPMGSGSCGKEAWVRLSGCRCLRGRAGGGPGGTRPRPGAGEVIVAEHPSLCSRARWPLELVSVSFHS